MENPLNDARRLLLPRCGAAFTSHSGRECACDREDGHDYPHGMGGQPEWGYFLGVAFAEVDRLRAGLDAIRRGYLPNMGCITACATRWDEDADCDCGYQRAADDPGDFASDVLSGEWSPPVRR